MRMLHDLFNGLLIIFRLNQEANDVFPVKSVS